MMNKTKIFRFRVTLQDLDNPVVWREIEVPATYTFEQFHKVLQIVFGWSDYHLYEFNDKKDYFDSATFRITVPSEYDAEYEEKTYNAFRKKLQSVFPKTKQLTYVYDYGDNWHLRFSLKVRQLLIIHSLIVPTAKDLPLRKIAEVLMDMKL